MDRFYLKLIPLINKYYYNLKSTSRNCTQQTFKLYFNFDQIKKEALVTINKI